MKFKKYSQAFQDVFAFNVSGKNGTYIEIGGNHPKKGNNTYTLEKNLGWTGFSIELNQHWKNEWSIRSNPIYWENAITFDYAKAVKENNLPMHINYLSCDIEPAENTFNALKKVISDGITFDCITFEHDSYQSNDEYEKIASEFLLNLGYKIAVTDVYYDKKENIFETWFVKESIFTKTITFDEWKGLFNL